MKKTPDIQLNDKERSKCEIWTRIMGYLRPTFEWNYGKRAEFALRKRFEEEKALKTHGVTDKNKIHPPEDLCAAKDKKESA